MHLLFLDESGQLSEQKLFALGGIAIRDADWQTLRDLWQSTLVEHRWPVDEVRLLREQTTALLEAILAKLDSIERTQYG